MIKLSNIKLITILALIGIMGIGVNAFAWRGMGGGHGAGCKRGYSAGCFGSYGLSAEETAKLEEQQKQFFDGTAELRGNIYKKNLELKQELAGDAPEMEKLSAIQKELSELQAQLAQKRLDHFLKIRQINPHLGRGYGYGGGFMNGGCMGRGHGWGRGFGHGGGFMHGGCMGRGHGQGRGFGHGGGVMHGDTTGGCP